MKVLMIAPQPFLEPRGTPISVYQRVRGLASLGHTIDLVTYHIGQDVEIPGVTIHRIPRVPFVRQIKVGPSWIKPVLDLLLTGKTLRLLTTNRYDVIHAHEEAAFFSVLLASVFRTSHVYDMHSSLPRQLANFNFGNFAPLVKAFEMLERLTINKSDAVITIGSDLEEHVAQIYPAVKQVMIENLPVHDPNVTTDAASLDRLKREHGLSDRLAIVYAGTFERYQGLGLLIESASILRERHPEAKFLLVGGKPHQVDYWKRQAHALGLQDFVTFLGTVPLAEASTYLALADILVSPRTEGTSVPLKIYSYLLEGRPIVATNLTCHTLVLDQDTAILVEPTGPAFADGISLLIRDPELRTQLGLQSQQLAREKYSPDAYLAKLARVYQAIEPPALKPARLLA